LIKNTLFIWACDYSETSGEGKLARLFIKKKFPEKKYNLKFSQKKTMYQKYISTIFGIIYCWRKYLSDERVCYLNYLPLWNFLIFIFLPPQTILGPITGGANFSKSNKLNFFIRSIIFPIFYKISEFFLTIRTKRIIFSTDLLKKYLSKKTKKKSEFNFIFKSVKFKKKITKKYDFIIYHRKHKNKLSFFSRDFIEKLVLYGFKVIVVGDHLNIKSIKNYGYKNNKSINKMQSMSRYTVASAESIYSFFTLESISNHVKVLVDIRYKSQIKYFKKSFVYLNHNKLNNLKKIIKK
jgi:hypothetical protein